MSLANAAGANEKLAAAIANNEWGRAYMEHPVVRRAPAGQVVWPLALYVDGRPFQRRGSLLALCRVQPGYPYTASTGGATDAPRRTCYCLG